MIFYPNIINLKTKNMIYIDIETIPSPTMPSMDELKVPGNISKPETIEKWKQENQESEWRKEALNSLKGQIVCIGYAVDDDDITIITGIEREIIEYFADVVKANSRHELCGHHVLGFDIPFIFHKMLKYGIRPPLQFLTDKHSMIIDTNKIFNPYSYKEFYSLKSLAEFFGIEKDNSTGGADVFDLWKAGNIEAIKDHCRDDVRVTREVYKRINFYYENK